jgi:hypothetical protein
MKSIYSGFKGVWYFSVNLSPALSPQLPELVLFKSFPCFPGEMLWIKEHLSQHFAGLERPEPAPKRNDRNYVIYQLRGRIYSIG